MFLILVALAFMSYLYYNEMFKRSRDYRLIKEFPSLGVEVPVIGSAWKFLGDSEALMTAVASIIFQTLKLGGAARVYLFTTYYIVLCDAQDTAFALRTCLEKDYVYTFFRTFSGNGSAFISGPIAKERRAVLVPSFHPKLLFSFVDTFSEESVKLTDMLACHAGKGPFSVEIYLHTYILRSVLRTGVDISDDEIYCEEFCVALRRWEMIAKDRLFTIWKHPDFLYRCHPQYEEGKRVFKTLHKYAQKVLHRRQEELKCHSNSNSKPDTKNSLKGIFDSIINYNLGEEAFQHYSNTAFPRTFLTLT